MSDEAWNASSERKGTVDSPPALSVVVVPYLGTTSLSECLASLAGQTISDDVEILVPLQSDMEACAAVASEIRQARILTSADGRTEVLRSLGVRHARGRIVAITDDQSRPPENWCRELVEAHKLPVAAVGGPVVRDAGAGPGMAIYLMDYGRYRPPLKEGPTLSLTDVNTAYKRWALELVREVWEHEFHEPEVNGALLAGGGVLWLAPSAVVRHVREISLRDAIEDRYHHGRLFASRRITRAPFLRRVLLLLLAPLLPALILARATKGASGTPGGLSAFAGSAPGLVAAAVAWSWGELCGFLTGRAALPSRQPPSITDGANT